MSFIKNIKSSFAADAALEAERDRGDLVQTLILVAGFAVASLLAVNWLSTALLNKAADAAQCIEGSNTYAVASVSATECGAGKSHAKVNSFKKDVGYDKRFTVKP